MTAPAEEPAQSGSKGSEKPKKVNPKCGKCSHPYTFHGRRDPTTHRRKCNAFGCDCKNWQKPTEA